MTFKHITISAIALLISVGAASAASVEKSATVNAKPADVWAKIGSFCQIASWHPAITKCELKTVDHRAHRVLTLGDGATILEMQTDHRSADDKTMNYSYIIHKSPLPIKNYASFIGVEAEGEETKVTWRSIFDANGVDEAKAKEVIGGIYDGGLASIQAIFAPKAP